MNRKLVLAMMAALALAVGCGDDDGGDGSTGGSYFGGMCMAATLATDCPTAGSALTACCTASGTCGASVDGACETGCGTSPCLAGPVGTSCCSEGMCGTLSAGSCVVTPNAMCGAQTCTEYQGHPGCCMTDGATCGNLYRGTCTAQATLMAALTGGGGTGGTSAGTTSGTTAGTGDAGAGVMCGTASCPPFTFQTITAMGCCKDAATNTCGYNATAIDATLTCATQAEVTAALLGGLDGGATGGDSGATTGDASTTTGDASTTTGDGAAGSQCEQIIGAAVQSAGGAGLAAGCCTADDKCGISFLGGACDPALVESFVGMELPCGGFQP